MSKVTYEVNIGGHTDKVRVSIDLRIAAGLSQEDYETLRQALQTIEDIAYHYKKIRGEDEPQH